MTARERTSGTGGREDREAGPAAPPEILTFHVAGRRFALPARDVREILPAVAVTPLPGAPGVVEGIINLRGRLVPVLDLRPRLGLPKSAVSPADHFVVTAGGSGTLVLWVDGVESLAALPGGVVEEVPDAVPRTESIVGAAMLPDGIVLIHDALRFLSPGEEASIAEAMRELGPPGRPE